MVYIAGGISEVMVCNEIVCKTVIDNFRKVEYFRVLNPNCIVFL